MKKSGYDQFFKAAAQKSKTKAKPITSEKLTEQKLRRALGKPHTRKTKPFPVTALVGMILLLGLGIVYLAKPELIDKLTRHVEVKWMGEAVAAAKQEKPAAAPAKDAAGKAESADHDVSPKAPAAIEDLSYIDKLRSRKEELDMREKELNQLEEELQRQKVEVDQRIRKLELMRRDIAGVLKERVESDETQVNKLVDLYSNMKPKQAADVIGSLQEDLAVTVLGKMKKKNAAEVMNLLPSEKARGLSEKLTGYKR